MLQYDCKREVSLEREEKMVEITSDFERFLFANFPDEYRRATVEGVEEDVITAIKSRLEREYQIWCSVPEWIKAEYRDNLPDEVINGNVTVKEFIADEIAENNPQMNSDDVDLCSQVSTDMALSLLALGYSAETIARLNENRMERHRLEEVMAMGILLTDEQKQQWAETRARDRDAIMEDWKTNQPEKYFMHILKDISKLENRRDRVSSDAELASLDMKEVALARELREFSMMFESPEGRQRFVNYFRDERQQAALSHMGDNVIGLLVDVLGENGIRLEAKPNDGRNDNGLDRDSLAFDLREQFLNGGADVFSIAERYMEGPAFGRSSAGKGAQQGMPMSRSRDEASI